MTEVMELLDRAFNTLSTVTILASEADKVSAIRAELRQAYALLQNAGKETTDGRQNDKRPDTSAANRK